MSERYLIEKSLGKGRAGNIYLAQDTLMGRQVTLRRFEDAPQTQEFRDGFLELVRKMVQVEHPNVLSILDAGFDDSGPYIVGARVKGPTVRDLLSHAKKTERPISLRHIHTMIAQLLEAIDDSQQHGFYHYHLRTTSVVAQPRVDGLKHYVMMDLGYNKLTELLYGKNANVSHGLYDPAFVAPELYDGNAQGVITSMFMLGQLCYTMLAGKHPMDGMSLETSYAKHRVGELPSIKGYRYGLSVSFVNWLNSLINPDWKQRPQTISEALSRMPALNDMKSEGDSQSETPMLRD